MDPTPADSPGTAGFGGVPGGASAEETVAAAERVLQLANSIARQASAGNVDDPERPNALPGATAAGGAGGAPASFIRRRSSSLALSRAATDEAAERGDATSAAGGAGGRAARPGQRGSARRSSGPPPCRALVLLNFQQDHFASLNGSFAIDGAEEALAIVQRLRRTRKFDAVFVCSTTREADHRTFCSNNPGTMLMEVAPLKGLGSQTMWPQHCVLGTRGARLHRELPLEPTDVHLSFGFNPTNDVFSPLSDVGVSSGRVSGPGARRGSGSFARGGGLGSLIGFVKPSGGDATPSSMLNASAAHASPRGQHRRGSNASNAHGAAGATSPFKQRSRSGPAAVMRASLSRLGVNEMYICGLATDYSVLHTAVDARGILPRGAAPGEHMTVFVIEEACAGVRVAALPLTAAPCAALPLELDVTGCVVLVALCSFARFLTPACCRMMP